MKKGTDGDALGISAKAAFDVAPQQLGNTLRQISGTGINLAHEP